MGTVFPQKSDDKGGPFSPKFHYDKTDKHRFDIEDGKWLDYLQENGYVVSFLNLFDQQKKSETKI